MSHFVTKVLTHFLCDVTYSQYILSQFTSSVTVTWFIDDLFGHLFFFSIVKFGKGQRTKKRRCPLTDKQKNAHLIQLKCLFRSATLKKSLNEYFSFVWLLYDKNKTGVLSFNFYLINVKLFIYTLTFVNTAHMIFQNWKILHMQYFIHKLIFLFFHPLKNMSINSELRFKQISKYVVSLLKCTFG